MRADKFFSQKYGSRTKAQEILKDGLVLLRGKPLRAKDEVTGEEEFEYLESATERFVSGGGKKLERALSVFGESVKGCVCADLGASTGGFTDCLLRRGAKKVFCVDVGESQLNESIANDSRVAVLDRTNARYLQKESFSDAIDVVTGDLSFISLRLIVPAVVRVLPEGGRAFLLFKPQFECGGKGLNGSGILHKKYHAALLADFYDFCKETGLAPVNITNAPVVAKKNVEYVIFAQKGGCAREKAEFLSRAQEFLREKT